MDAQTILTAIAPVAGIAGLLSAGRAIPFALRWPQHSHPFAARLAMLNRPTPGMARKAAGALLLSAVLTGGALAAYAAEPSAPEQLPKEVVGVVGSGDHLGLQIKSGAGVRTIKTGETYADGWSLSALPPSTATLTKNGRVATVGLNPTGGAATETSDPAAPSQFAVIGGPSAEMVDRYYQRYIASGAPAARADVLNPDQAKRAGAYSAMISEEIANRRAQVAASALTDQPARLTSADMQALLGAGGYQDMLALNDQIAAADQAQYETARAAGNTTIDAPPKMNVIFADAAAPAIK